jgi:hypothetical protein
MGPGGWMLMEGYMMQSAGVAGTQHEFREKLIELMGEDKTDIFFEEWRANHFTKQDVDSLAAWGFNSIRLPMHYNLFTLPIEDEPVQGEHTWLTTGFEMIDELLDWCESNQMYLILDLHAAPGGQGYNADISDYDPDKPSLWESELNEDKTVALWTRLADRYKDEEWMGGYDLINETNWELPGGTQLRELYEEITTAIRTVDTDHIIFIEGNWFANDFTGLTPPWDDNMVYSFHKYWNKNDDADLDWVLPLREEHNVPLWMGETGENSNTWFTEAVTLFENKGIGWSWWTMRKIETITSPYSVILNPGYQDILDYWNGEGPQPSETEAFDAMMQLAENLLVENSFYHPDVKDALFRQVETDETIPYTKLIIPGVIPMSDFDLGKNGFAYYDIDAANYQLSTGQYQAWNSGWTYRNDGVDIEKNDNPNTNGYHLGFTHEREWINYTVQIAESAAYRLKTLVASLETGGMFHFSLDGEAITTSQTAEATGGWTEFVELEIQDVILEAGEHTLTFHVDNDIPVNVANMDFVITGAVESVLFTALGGQTYNEKTIQLNFNQSINPETLNGSLEDFTLQINGFEKTISSVNMEEGKSRTLILVLENAVSSTDDIKVSYEGNVIKSPSDMVLESFTDLIIINDLPTRFLIPGRIEAEDFESMQGFQTEETTDAGGGLNLGFVNSGDYADYLVFVETESDYQVSLRLASLADEGNLGLFLVDESEETELFTMTTPVTGGWQTWTTETVRATLPAGSHILRLKILADGEFNINWFEFNVVTGLESSVISDPIIYPNPTKKMIQVKSMEYDQFSIISFDGSIIGKGKIPKSNSLDLGELSSGLYILKLIDSTTGNSSKQRVIIEK